MPSEDFQKNNLPFPLKVNMTLKVKKQMFYYFGPSSDQLLLVKQ
jgi:hypothetical protein